MEMDSRVLSLRPLCLGARVSGNKVFLRHFDVVSTNTFSNFVHIGFAYKCNIVFQDKAIQFNLLGEVSCFYVFYVRNVNILEE